VDKYKEVDFYLLKKFLGKEQVGNIGIIKEGKLIGLLKTKKGTSNETQEERSTSRKKALR
jgi:hypothetical protein